MFDKRQIFSIRKFSVGVASVLLGFGILSAATSSVSAAEINGQVTQQAETLDYQYVDYDELTDSQKEAIIQATPDNVKQSDKVYYFVYKSNKGGQTVLPKTGLNDHLAYVASGFGLLVLAVGLGKKNKKMVRSVIALSVFGTAVAYPISVLASNQELAQYNQQISVNDKGAQHPVLDIPGYTYYGYFVVDKAAQSDKEVASTETTPIVDSPKIEAPITKVPDSAPIVETLPNADIPKAIVPSDAPVVEPPKSVLVPEDAPVVEELPNADIPKANHTRSSNG